MIRKRWVSLLFIFLAQNANAKFYIVGTDIGPTAESPRFVDLGDGSDGPFNASTYTNFGTVSGSKIILNLDSKNTFNFTDFVLEAGYVIEPIGSKPLIIKSLLDVRIKANAGIRCGGATGGTGSQMANASGGVGRCGGGGGGDGVVLSAGTNGSAGGADVTGGAGAISDAANPGGGGGGGGYFYSASTGSARTNGSQGAVAGNEYTSDLLFKTTLGRGGSGGGGGGAYTTINGSEGSGGGGGGGGGTVVVFARRDLVLESDSSFISTMGGTGGSGGTGLSAGGGGGAGGTIWVVAESVSSQPYVGGISPPESGFVADQGLGGNDGTGRAGGNGSRGRVWVVDSNCDFDVANSCGEDSSIYPAIDVRDGVAYSVGEYGKAVWTNVSEIEFKAACGVVGSNWWEGLFFLSLFWLITYLPRYAQRWRYKYS